MPAEVADLTARATATRLSPADRSFALDTLAFIDDPAAAKAMLSFAQPNSPLRESATWWLLNRMSSDWSGSEYGLRPALKAFGRLSVQGLLGLTMPADARFPVILDWLRWP